MATLPLNQEFFMSLERVLASLSGSQRDSQLKTRKG